ncbi:MAG: hypothetical protein ACREOZ_00915, partial [Gloeomargaritales cyanobacterium]
VNDISTICQQLEAANKLPDDVATVVCLILSKCSVEAFKFAYLTKGSELVSDADKYTYSEILDHATYYYQSLVDSGEWLNTTKTESEFQGLLNRMAKLEMGKNHNKGNGSAGTVPSHIKCFRCKGNHFLRNCPEREKGGKKTGGWKMQAPTAGTGATTKSVDGVLWHWCAKCNRWNTTHATNEHRIGVGRSLSKRTGVSPSDETVVTSNVGKVSLSMISGF